MRATVFDYGAGNLHSIAKALAAAGARVTLTADPVAALDTELLVLPGVGAFGPAALRLASARERVRATLAGGLPCLGVCLGMQLLMESSDEGPGHGIGLVAGRVTRLAARRVPHIGWNTIEGASDPTFARAPIATAYFANGYACRPRDARVVTAWTEHETDRFPAALRAGHTVGVQFHPEKSGRAGVAWIAALIDALRGRSADDATPGSTAHGRPPDPLTIALEPPTIVPFTIGTRGARS